SAVKPKAASICFGATQKSVPRRNKIAESKARTNRSRWCMLSLLFLRPREGEGFGRSLVFVLCVRSGCRQDCSIQTRSLSFDHRQDLSIMNSSLLHICPDC